MTGNFPRLVNGKDTQVQEEERFQNKMNPKKTKLRHIIIEMVNSKVKERNLKAVKERHLVSYKEVPLRLLAYFSTQTF